MKSLIALSLLTLTMSESFARGPYFPNPDKAPISHGIILFNSPELSSLGNGEYIGDVVIKKHNRAGYEVGPMIYSCTFNDDDGSYGSLGCRYVRYLSNKAKSYEMCDIYYNEEYNCY